MAAAMPVEKNTPCKPSSTLKIKCKRFKKEEGYRVNLF